MNGAFYIGATGLGAQQRALEAVANNIGNINTTAFKRSAISFSELMMPVPTEEGAPVAAQNRTMGLGGVAFGATSRVWTQGDLRQTGNKFDIAIDGPGFIELMGAAGRTLLWRGGTLKVNSDGYLATSDGTPLKAMISVPTDATALSIGRDGMVSATVDGEDSKPLGQIDLTMVKDPGDLVGVENGVYEAADGTAPYTVAAGSEGGGIFAQGAVEGANVQLSDEMVTLLLLQRAFSANAQVVQAGDQLMSIVNSLRR